MDKLLLENYPPETIQRISNGILNGTSDDEDGMTLMRLFCLYVDENKEVPAALNQHFSKAFKLILKESKEPKAALAIIKKNHPNHPSKKDRMQLAYAFLMHRLDGKKTDAAYDFVSSEFGWGRTAIYEAWTEHKEEAIQMFKIFCHTHSRTITESEQKILNKIID